MLDWLHHVAAWASPIVSILAVPGAIVTFIITIRRGRRWALAQLAQWVAEQQHTTLAAQAALESADSAAEASRAALAFSKTASTQSYVAGDNSRQANDAIEFLAGHIGHALDEISMAGRIDGLLTANVRYRNLLREHGIPDPETARQDDPEPTGEPAPASVEDTDAITVTGRHRLRGYTTAIDTIPEGDPE